MAKDLLSILDPAKPVSGEKLARKLGISRQALHKRISSLRRRGYRIQGKQKAGYRILREPDRILLSRILNELKTRSFGKNLIVVEKTDSTQNEAKTLAEKGVSEGTAVLAEEQTAGKGRLGRTWESGRGGLWFSVILRPAFAPQKASLLAMAASVAVAKALEAGAKIRCRLKWPNDVLVETHKGAFRKISGSLVEMSAESDSIRWVVLGVGIDVNNSLPKDLRKTAVTLKEVSGRTIDRTALLLKVFSNLEAVYGAFVKRGFASFKGEYARRSILRRGMEVKLTDPSAHVKGKFSGFGNDGSIILALSEGKKSNFFAGDIS